MRSLYPKSCITIISPKDKPGMTSIVKNLFKRSNKAHRRAIRTRNTNDIETHRTLRREAKCAWRKAQHNFYSNLNNRLSQEKKSPKLWWRTVKSNLGVTETSSIPVLCLDGLPITCDVIKCEMLNDYFASQCNDNSSVNSGINDGEDDEINVTASECELSDVVVTDSAIIIESVENA